ncbi:hypothetical protein QAD02_019753 [Eretmocerus hayati]|uniref:Uncharacterized protein n=1 Tax=Eretmocerus hayati TaxID=131215 RepID=A0ACC2PKH6_9HYME|nr:hypothetical protein QAD02_019753 [Eretmocerus hayati]
MNGDEPGSDLQECGTGSEYGSGSEETAALLSRPSVTPLVIAPQAVVVLGGASSSSSGSINSGPTQQQQNFQSQSQQQQNNASCSGQLSGSGKPVLQRQDRATFLVASPQLSVSGLGGSEESGTGIDDPATRSVPDIELQCRMDDQPHTILPSTAFSSSHYRPRHSHVHRCRCERRDSLAPMSALHLARSISRESVRSGGLQHCCPCQVGVSSMGASGSGLYSSIYAGGSGGTLPPPLLVTTSPTTRMIRQSSQPEAHPGSSSAGVGGSCCCCSGCSCPLQHGVGGVATGSSATPSAASLRQLREPGDGIAGIAADSLRINGGIRQFRQYPVVPEVVARSQVALALYCALGLWLQYGDRDFVEPSPRQLQILSTTSKRWGPTLHPQA